ncbi:MAG: FkbM family methyltransferase [Chromatiales bacterium]|nr:FkbM family methyltransferase [Chromatiales bacterium]
MSTLRAAAYLFQRWVLRRPFLDATIPEHGLRLRVHTDDVIGRHLYKYRRYETEVTRCLLQTVRLQPGDVVLDVGANIGWYSLVLGRAAPPGVDILAFEPDQDNFALLRANLAANGVANVTPVPAAAGPEERRERLYRYDHGNAGRHSLLPIHGGAAVDVDTVRLDDEWDRRGFGDRPLRLIKIDVEGYELAALRGAPRLLGRCQWLLGEFSPGFMRRGGVDPADLVGLLTGAGLVPSRIGAGGLVPCTAAELLRQERQTNILWSRPGATGG